jgi:ammonium transporter, Amt family
VFNERGAVELRAGLGKGDLVLYPHWLGPGDNAWQLTAATFVGLMSVPGLVVLYGGVMQKRWSVNSMMLSFVAFAIVLVMWVLYGFRMGFGDPVHIAGSSSSFLSNLIGKPGPVLNHAMEQGQAKIPELGAGGALDMPESSLVYFQFVFAAITPILMLGSVLGRVRFKAWIPFVLLWSTCIYTVNAFLIWGGGWFAQQGAVDFSGGYVIHLAAGVSGFVAAAVIGPRLARDREVDAPNNLAMVALGAGLLWLGWNGFNGGDPYNVGADASAAVLNTNLCTAVAFLVWVCCDYATNRKPSLIGSVNGMIVGLVAITPAAGFVNGYGAIMIGVIATVFVYAAYNYLALVPPFNRVDDTLGVVYTHGFAGLAGGLLTGIFADSAMEVVPGFSVSGGLNQLKWQALTALWVIVFCAIGTYVLLKLVGLVTSLRMTDEEMEMGDLAVHGHEVYPSDIPSLAFPSGAPAPVPTPAPLTQGGGGASG